MVSPIDQRPAGAADPAAGTQIMRRDDLLDLTFPNIRTVMYDSDLPQDSVVSYRGGASLTFGQIARIIPCFTAGTRVITAQGQIAAQDLQPGDRVLTRDNGFQTITWAGRRTMTFGQCAITADMRPVLIRRDALGPQMPERDMIVSPNHRVLVAGKGESLCAAKNMTHLPGIDFVPVADVTYIHFMCERHEIVSSDGAWTETFQPNDDSLQGIDTAQRDELLAIFPDLASAAGRARYTTARETTTQAAYLLSA